MAMIFFLKMLGDLSLYYIVATPFSVFLGSGDLLLCALLQSLIYALARLPRQKWLQLLLLIPMTVCYFLCRGSAADLIALIPPGGYILWRVIRSSPAPLLDDQRELLERLWKPVSLAVGAAWLLFWANGVLPIFSADHAASVALLPKRMLFFALSFFVSAVMLLRTLRHDMQMYGKLQFHLVNAGALCVIPAAALILGSDAVSGLVSSLFKGFYSHVLIPLIVLLAALPSLIAQWVLDLLKPMIPTQGLEEATTPMEQGQFQDTLENTAWASGSGDAARSIVYGILIVAALALLFLLYRWLRRSGHAVFSGKAGYEQRIYVPTGQTSAPARELPPVQSIRRHYRRFLKLCAKKGIERNPSSTSLDMDTAARKYRGLEAASPRIRQLYIRARYASRATREDVQEITRLYNEARKKL